MKKLFALLVTLAFTAVFAQEIRITGYGGQDPAVVVRLLGEVIGPDLEAEGITLKYEPLEGDYNPALFNQLSAGTAGDIIYIPVETAPGIIATGKVLALAEVGVDTSPFLENLLAPYTIDGKVYGIPKDFNTLALHYNKDLFDEAGVEYPNDEDTWETFAEKVRGVAALGGDVKGVCFPASFDRFGAFAFAAGWQPFDAEGKSNLQDENLTTAVTWYTDLVKEGVAVQPSDIGAGWTGDCLKSDNVGVAMEGAWILGFLRDNAPNLQYGTAKMPIGPSGKRGNFIYTVAYGINADSANKEAAAKVLAALTSEKAQQWVLEQGLAIPSRSAIADNPYFAGETPEAMANKEVFEGAADGNVYGFQFGSIGLDWQTPINAALAAIMTGQKDVATALADAQGELDALMNR
jgi:multiple sugar transport system substrate-binding protein